MTKLPMHIRNRTRPITHYQLLRMLDKGCRFYRVDTTKDLPSDVVHVTYDNTVYALAHDDFK
ncbi:hypothetical protein UFOVP1193_10 [uncultured Caudovirales phage]|uniref:Uncharacterized protein n=1 Tax=uncultured Caudovirales phage TaxID=2100421 RepID=A0A6J5QYD9_9CAUD|nr:hypothetical protein UFOVP1193_10 [uncultured Caudovirales phage]